MIQVHLFLNSSCYLSFYYTIELHGFATSNLQPLDVALNKPFKDQMRKIYTNWLTKQVMDDNIEEALTNTGYLRQPTTEDLLE